MANWKKQHTHTQHTTHKLLGPPFASFGDHVHTLGTEGTTHFVKKGEKPIYNVLNPVHKFKDQGLFVMKVCIFTRILHLTTRLSGYWDMGWTSLLEALPQKLAYFLNCRDSSTPINCSICFPDSHLRVYWRRRSCLIRGLLRATFLRHSLQRECLWVSFFELRMLDESDDKLCKLIEILPMCAKTHIIYRWSRFRITRMLKSPMDL